MRLGENDIICAITGASGALYGLHLLKALVAAERRVHVLVSSAGRLVINTETEQHLDNSPSKMAEQLTAYSGAKPGQLYVYGKEQWMAPIASGSNTASAMVVCPCTTGTLGAIAAGTSRSLIERAADVCIKESRKLVLVVRETPLSAIHLENMLRLNRAGVTILPANPGFYARPESVEDLVDTVVGRVLDQLGVTHELGPRWGDE